MESLVKSIVWVQTFKYRMANVQTFKYKSIEDSYNKQVYINETGTFFKKNMFILRI